MAHPQNKLVHSTNLAILFLLVTVSHASRVLVQRVYRQEVAPVESISNEVSDCGPCPEELDPKCGFDGYTYNNECDADCEHISIVKDGPCPDFIEGCDCPMEWKPACGKDRVTYWNKCSMECAMAEYKHGGECDPCDCGKDYEPVCGVDETTYNNKCEADCAIVEIAHEGECVIEYETEETEEEVIEEIIEEIGEGNQEI